MKRFEQFDAEDLKVLRACLQIGRVQMPQESLRRIAEHLEAEVREEWASRGEAEQTDAAKVLRRAGARFHGDRPRAPRDRE